MSVELRFGVTENQQAKVANIFYDAFGAKFNKFYGNKPKVINFLSKSLRNDRTVVALKNGKLVGFAGLEHDKKSFIGPCFKQTSHVFDLATFVAVFVAKFFVLAKKTKPKELHLESLAVSKTERGKWVGSKLLQFVLNYARSKGFSQIKLEVVDTNPRARQLYERFGFKEVEVHKVPYPFSFLLGFKSVTEMVCNL
ncbi:MAG: GNAT family N-acetyltransferase [Candidatus Bathyarchaeota archaeon]|nr:GNAT family N-acetyltransferase [Candidatus Bathyarchaeum tardum]